MNVSWIKKVVGGCRPSPLPPPPPQFNLHSSMSIKIHKINSKSSQNQFKIDQNPRKNRRYSNGGIVNALMYITYRCIFHNKHVNDTILEVQKVKKYIIPKGFIVWKKIEIAYFLAFFEPLNRVANTLIMKLRVQGVRVICHTKKCSFWG